MIKLEYVINVGKGFEPQPDDNIYSSIFSQYEKVIIESLMTSFGMDFLVQDRYGGDVDTIHNVRKIGKDPLMRYKNDVNRIDYDNRGIYDSKAYHQDSRYIEINRKASEDKKNGDLTDTYTGKKVARNADIDLDHVIAAKEIHDDRGRVLAGLDGKSLANCRENLKPTDRSINRSMKDKDINDYINSWEERKTQRAAREEELKNIGTLTDKERKELNKLEKLDSIDPDRMRYENEKSRKAYEVKIAKAYYTSPQFAKDTIFAAGKIGTQMALRQAFGFLFANVWFSVKEEFEKNNISFRTDLDMEAFFKAVAAGVRRGVEKTRSMETVAKLIEGSTAGILASISTTLCNIFFTTAKNVVKIIRQSYASIVEALKVLFINPENYLFGDMIKAVAKILATGASVVLGSIVSAALESTPIGKIPVIGDVVQTFCGTLVTGIMSCTLLMFIDRSNVSRKLVSFLNKIQTIDKDVLYYKHQAENFERYAAELMCIDIDRFEREVEAYSNAVQKIMKASDDKELNSALISIYKKLEIKTVWNGYSSFDDFMKDKNSNMVFE